jgi:hypothetical protein
MHCVLHDITPMLFDIWNGSETKAEGSSSNSNRPPYWSSADDAKGMAMERARPQIPGYLGPAPRRIDVHYSFKATEWKAWLLFLECHYWTSDCMKGYLAYFCTLSQLYVYALATRKQIAEEEINRIKD